METNRGPWITTYLLKRLYFTNPLPHEIDIIDIAHGLSNICRFAGQCKQFYSVAEHCCLVSDAASTPEAKRWALLHDAAEAYTGDIPRPLKELLPGLKPIEKRITTAVAKKFGLPNRCPPEVKELDNRILRSEGVGLFSVNVVSSWHVPGEGLGVQPQCWPPETASGEFLRRFRELFPGGGNG